MWPRSWRLGLEAVSRRSSASARSRLGVGTPRPRLGLELWRPWSRSRLKRSRAHPCIALKCAARESRRRRRWNGFTEQNCAESQRAETHGAESESNQDVDSWLSRFIVGMRRTEWRSSVTDSRHLTSEQAIERAAGEVYCHSKHRRREDSGSTCRQPAVNLLSVWSRLSRSYANSWRPRQPSRLMTASARMTVCAG